MRSTRLLKTITSQAWRTILIVLALSLCIADNTIANNSSKGESGENESNDTSATLIAAIEGYQEALSIADSTQRTAAFRNVEIELASLLEELPVNETNYTADLYVNWGNAALQVGDLGTAVLAYRKALLLDPFHRRAKKNLTYVREQLPSWTSPKRKQSTISSLFFWQYYFSPETSRLLAATFFAVGSLILSVSIYRKSSSLKFVSLIPFLIWLLLLGSSMWNSDEVSSDEVVFVAEETQCRSADSDVSTVIFDSPIPAGAEAVLLQNRENWVEVAMGGKQSGWVPRSAIKFVE